MLLRPIAAAPVLIAACSWPLLAEPTTAPAKSATTEAQTASLTREEQKFLDLNQRRITACYAAVGDQFFVCPTWDPEYPSSAHLTLARWTADNTERRRVTAGTLVRIIEDKPPREEALAAVHVIPDMRVAAYGHIHSAQVVEIRGPEEMIVTAPWPIDLENYRRERQRDQRKIDQLEQEYRERQRRERERQRDRNRSSSSRYRNDDRRRDSFDARQLEQQLEQHYRHRDRIAEQAEKWKSVRLRILGFPTTGLTPGQRWHVDGDTGPQIVIVAEDAEAEGSRSRFSRGPGQLVAVNGQKFARPLTDSQFRQLLASAKLTPDDFIALSRKLMAEHGFEAAQPRIIAALEQARRENQPTATVSAEQPTDATDDSKSAGDKSDWFERKHGKKADKGQKPGTSKSDTPGKSEKSDSKKSWFEKKYGDRLKKD